MTRETILSICYGARTLSQIAAAKEARGEWLRDHADDVEMLEVGGCLSKLEDAIRRIEPAAPIEPFATTAS